MNEKEVGLALAVMAHPDDAEFFVGGTAAELASKGWDVHFVSMTKGECGSRDISGEEIAIIRDREARDGARIIGATYETLGLQDGHVPYDMEIMEEVVGIVRKTQPSIIFTHPLVDYMADHTNTHSLVLGAIPESRHSNFKTKKDHSTLSEKPSFYLCDPETLKGLDGQIPPARTIVDISNVINLKIKAFEAHKSQIHPSPPDKRGSIDVLKAMGTVRGLQIEVQFAEGFNRVLLEGAPAKDRLFLALGDKVQTL